MEPEFILIAEDQDQVRTMLGQILTQHGYRVLEASDGPHALRLASWHKGPIHLLLTDIRMPGMDGRELYDQLRQVRDDVCVLFMSGYAEGALDPDAALLRKPFTVRELLVAVHAVLGAPARKPVQMRGSGARAISRSVA